MENYIPISFLNDFIFCPRSIYFHQLYGRSNESIYHTTAQSEGKLAHKSIDNKTYTTSKKVLQTIEIYSHRFGLGGKIDTFNIDTKVLTERKKKITKVYDGYIYQLYAQYHCLVDMGYDVKTLRLYSMNDNKIYPIKLPNEDLDRQKKFEELIHNMKKFDLNSSFSINPNKCNCCIYKYMCDVAP
ncbi:type V CRISPR-associated protein Cas4 [Aliarcobacter butzleri]|uniref:type V CRISPR-associated protein Cas4 n=1 Tax=Aliarcobacter butzleri TaxID=28197 RepID=UPI0021B1D789|nr:type V CRISPR-associated protein Cas4 [Aliarcobacter butzleri]MCT7564126.1 type V CRISPR-associated protein Cas4 [Aliarcobacter butzleri]MCT7578715.1 type V CRISPR-associated protein Cas4 [Aliarcobacter butzleri]MCT7647658.1 type V CRISPR-associated protein Cas4 [Aliarcobacter butzleri]